MTGRASPTGAADGAALDRPLARRIAVNWEMVAWAAVIAAACALRFWDLGARALHHDESIHAKWAWDLAQGYYRHSPVYHGPLLYVAQGFTFLVGTATDYTARVSPALFGMGVVVAPLALRRWLGPGGALAAGAFLALSPTAVYYSRFLRMDVYLAFFTLLAVAALWRYLDGGRARWLVAYALALALAFSTKEVAFLLVAVLLLALNAHLAGDLARAALRARGGESSRPRFAALAAACFPVAWAAAALWPLLERPRRALGWRELPRSGDLLVLTGALTLPLLTAFAKGPIVWLLGALGDGAAAGRFDYSAICAGGGRGDLLVLGGAFAITTGLAAAVGAAWRPRIWLVAAGLAAIVYATLMTSFWTNLDGLCSGPWGSIDHWQAQQDFRRGDQPWFYYLMLMPAYEFLILVPALAGGVWAVARGPSFARFLVFWFVALFAALSFAGEKMPWLNTHLALPCALLAAWTLRRAWNAWRPRPFDRRAAAAFAIAAAAAALAAVALAFDWGTPMGARLVWALVVLLLAAVAGGAAFARRFDRRALPALAGALLLAALAVFSVRAMALAVYERGDVPRDLLIYTQSSPDVARLADDIDALAAASGKGPGLRIAVDTHASLHWPWVWYLRDYLGVSYAGMEAGPPGGAFDVLLVHAANGEAVRRALAAGGADRVAVRHPHRWWFPEDYKRWPAGEGETARWGEPYEAETWRRIADGVFRRNWLGDAFAFWRDREPPRDPGALDALAFFPAAFDRETGRLARPAPGDAPPAAPAPPAADAAGRPVLGAPGLFAAPVDVEPAPDGGFYVIDRVTRRLLRFDARGNLLASVDVRASPDEESEPWGLAVAAGGRVYVADTFGWRVLAFDGATLERVLAFGERPPLDGEPPGPYHLYGPRDLAIDAAGNLWVTDTGQNRIVVYTPDGEYLREIGGPGSGPGQFSEPVGIAIGPAGEIAVADAWNARVQVLDASGAYLREFPVPGWGGRDAADKPYLRVLRDGRIALSLPSAGEVRVHAPDGALLAVVAPGSEPLLSPYGLMETADGRLWIVEGDGARVRRFAIPAPVEP